MCYPNNKHKTPKGESACQLSPTNHRMDEQSVNDMQVKVSNRQVMHVFFPVALSFPVTFQCKISQLFILLFSFGCFLLPSKFQYLFWPYLKTNGNSWYLCPLLLHGLERMHATKNLGVQVQHQSGKSIVVFWLTSLYIFSSY